jgi:hypothetical protein
MCILQWSTPFNTCENAIYQVSHSPVSVVAVVIVVHVNGVRSCL